MIVCSWQNKKIQNTVYRPQKFLKAILLSRAVEQKVENDSGDYPARGAIFRDVCFCEQHREVRPRRTSNEAVSKRLPYGVRFWACKNEQ